MKITQGHYYSNSLEPTNASIDREVIAIENVDTGRNRFVRVVYRVKWGAGMKADGGLGRLEECTLTAFEKFAKYDVSSSYTF